MTGGTVAKYYQFNGQRIAMRSGGTVNGQVRGELTAGNAFVGRQRHLGPRPALSSTYTYFWEVSSCNVRASSVRGSWRFWSRCWCPGPAPGRGGAVAAERPVGCVVCGIFPGDGRPPGAEPPGYSAATPDRGSGNNRINDHGVALGEARSALSNLILYPSSGAWLGPEQARFSGRCKVALWL